MTILQKLLRYTYFPVGNAVAVPLGLLVVVTGLFPPHLICVPELAAIGIGASDLHLRRLYWIVDADSCRNEVVTRGKDTNFGGKERPYDMGSCI